MPSGQVHYGGAFYWEMATDYGLIATSPRLQTVVPASASLKVKLPPTTALPEGGPYFFIYNASGSNPVAITDSLGSTTYVTLAAGYIAKVDLSADGWTVFASQYGGGRISSASFTNSCGGTVTPPPPDPDPECECDSDSPNAGDHSVDVEYFANTTDFNNQSASYTVSDEVDAGGFYYDKDEDVWWADKILSDGGDPETTVAVRVRVRRHPDQMPPPNIGSNTTPITDLPEPWDNDAFPVFDVYWNGEWVSLTVETGRPSLPDLGVWPHPGGWEYVGWGQHSDGSWIRVRLDPDPSYAGYAEPKWMTWCDPYTDVWGSELGCDRLRRQVDNPPGV